METTPRYTQIRTVIKCTWAEHANKKVDIISLDEKNWANYVLFMRNML